MMREQKIDPRFRSCLLLSADSPEDLRPCDVDRVMDAAADLGCLEELRKWLLDQELRQRTRQLVEEYVA